MKQIFYSSCFLRQLKKLPSTDKELLTKFEKIFRNDYFDPKLKTHKLSGKLEDFWACSLSYKTRLIFQIDSDDNIIFIDIGNHDIYK